MRLHYYIKDVVFIKQLQGFVFNKYIKIIISLLLITSFLLITFSGCTYSSEKNPVLQLYKSTLLSDFDKLDKDDYTIKKVRKEFLTTDFVTTKIYCEDVNGKEFEITKAKDGLVDNYINIKATETATDSIQKYFNDMDVKVLCDIRVLSNTSYGLNNDKEFYDYNKHLATSPYYYMWNESDAVNIYIFYTNKMTEQEINDLYVNSINALNNCYNDYSKSIKDEYGSYFLQYCYLIQIDDNVNPYNLSSEELNERVSWYNDFDESDQSPFHSIKSFYSTFDNGSIKFSNLSTIK